MVTIFGKCNVWSLYRAGSLKAGESEFTIFWMENLKGRDHLLRPKRRWEVSMDLRDREIVDWIHLAQDRDQWRVLVKMVMNLRVQ
jgi:hypothetical protein